MWVNQKCRMLHCSFPLVGGRFAEQWSGSAGTVTPAPKAQEGSLLPTARWSPVMLLAGMLMIGIPACMLYHLPLEGGTILPIGIS